ncbi:protein croquemort isoform X2 [Diabrotica virgifera virgifera]|nr:protein croquemort isoform X2 [Diabrotica virgifera virgifera]XP_028137287.1 protein croquemort isoform X2 [Diabrotica virgifera virgifera]XP_028137288.1 protein croquemort isoform X2 [Diabrotica virgifera virgifera]XP_050499796.1 protein croquemort isoform X2 [Diabrotica virgifera virgifera]XP_050499797.1 protein croquemort isoform X2 [Diabrotica virgifera virgifera]XP_050499798.1 protein croquemort isoform X2 [Diabrotica virgifera virgifera]
MHQTKQCGRVCLLFTGIFLICFGSCIFIFFESIYDLLLNYNLRFEPGSLAYQGWERSPPVETNIYLFNWTNPEDIKNHSVKPEFEELGPYRFYEVKGKSNISFVDEHVNYKTYTSSFFDEKKEGRNLSDVINSINTVAVSIGYQARFQSYWTKKMISFGIGSRSAHLYVTKTVRELLFDGYDDPILGIISKIPFVGAPEKGGLFFGRNGTVGLDGTYSLNYKNDEHFGEVLLWDGKNETNFFSGECNAVKGSGGEFFPLNRKRDQIVMFSSDLCKSLVLRYVEDVTIKGVHGYKYSAEYGFDNGTVHPENACFCNGECIPTGVFNISSCRQGSPSFLSFPHFYNADPIYQNAVKGMKPNKTQHEFYMILEPKSGIVMEVQAGMQLNMLIQRVSSISLYDKLPKIFMPVFHITHKAELTDEIASGLRMLQSLPEYCNYFFYATLLLGCFCISFALFSLFCCNKDKEKNKYDIHPVKTSLYEQVPMNEKKADIVWT